MIAYVKEKENTTTYVKSDIEAMVRESTKRMKVLQNDYDPITGEGAELYDEVTGEAILKRKWINIPDNLDGLERQFAPAEYYNNPLVKQILRYKSIQAFIQSGLNEDFTEEKLSEIQTQLLQLRYKTDFTAWAYLEVMIKPKTGDDKIVPFDYDAIDKDIQASYLDDYVEDDLDDYDDDWEDDIDERDNTDYSLVPFKLNYAQMRLLAVFEKHRLRGLPIRVILVKCRQWGGSTLTQIYMAWIQLLHKNGWYSAIVAQQGSTAKKIYMMYEKLISIYDSSLITKPNGQRLPAGEKLRFAQYGKSASDFRIVYGSAAKPRIARDAVVSIGTYNRPDSLPGSDVSMAHYSEVALWKKTFGKEPQDIIKSITGGLARLPYTMEVLESTPRGSGNYFALEYGRAKNHESERTAVFIPWMYSIFDTAFVKNKHLFAEWILKHKNDDECPKDDIPEHEGKKALNSGKYIYHLWELGATLEGIMWYIMKRREFDRQSDMCSEAPSDDIEAFENTEKAAFNSYDIEELRKYGTTKPLWQGDIKSDYRRGKAVLDKYMFDEDPDGPMLIWEKPVIDNMVDRYLVVVDIGGTWRNADYSVIRVFDRIGYYNGKCKEKTVLMYSSHIPHDQLAWKAVQIAKWYNNALLVFESNTLDTRDKNREVDAGEVIGYILDVIDYCYDNLYIRNDATSEDMQQPRPKKIGFHTNRKNKPEMVDLLKEVIHYCDYIESDQGTIDEMKRYERKDDGSYGAMDGWKDDRLMTAAIGLYLSRNERVMGKPRFVEKKNKGEKVSGVRNIKKSHTNESSF